MKKIVRVLFTWSNFLVACIGCSIGLHIVQYKINKAVAKNVTSKSELIHQMITIDSLQTVKIKKIVIKLNEPK